MSDYLNGAQVLKLLEPINPKRVGKDGKGFSHVEAYELRAMMTRLFGFARWSEEVTDQACIFETDNNGRWTVAYRSVVKVTVCAPDGTPLAVYTEGATGEAKNQPSRGDAHDLALKTSQSQAFKRAVVNLGDAFGLSLYSGGSFKPLVYRTLVMPGSDGSLAKTGEAVDAHITSPPAPETPAPQPEPSPVPAAPEPVKATAAVQDKVAHLADDIRNRAYMEVITAKNPRAALTRLLMEAATGQVGLNVVEDDRGNRVTLETLLNQLIVSSRKSA